MDIFPKDSVFHYVTLLFMNSSDILKALRSL